jgi:hypothetical protein
MLTRMALVSVACATVSQSHSMEMRPQSASRTRSSPINACICVKGAKSVGAQAAIPVMSVTQDKFVRARKW